MTRPTNAASSYAVTTTAIRFPLYIVPSVSCRAPRPGPVSVSAVAVTRATRRPAVARAGEVVLSVWRPREVDRVPAVDDDHRLEGGPVDPLERRVGCDEDGSVERLFGQLVDRHRSRAVVGRIDERVDAGDLGPALGQRVDDAKRRGSARFLDARAVRNAEDD